MSCFIVGQVSIAKLNYMNDPLLSKLFSWPTEKPAVAPDNQSMFVNAPQLKKLLSKQSFPLIIELGSWLGASTRFFLDHCPDSFIIAIDTWQGSIEHQILPLYSSKIATLFPTFLVNCWNYKDRLIPLRATTIKGMELVHELGLQPDLIYVDASHDYGSVYEDIKKAFFLFPHATICGDDWLWKPNPNTGYLPVQSAVKDFAEEYNCKIHADTNFWILHRPPAKG